MGVDEIERASPHPTLKNPFSKAVALRSGPYAQRHGWQDNSNCYSREHDNIITSFDCNGSRVLHESASRLLPRSLRIALWLLITLIRYDCECVVCSCPTANNVRFREPEVFQRVHHQTLLLGHSSTRDEEKYRI